MDPDGSWRLERPVTGGPARSKLFEIDDVDARRARSGRGATGRSRPCLRARLSVAAPSMKHVTTFSSVCAGTRARSSLPPLPRRAARGGGPGARVAHLERVAARAHLAREHDELDQQLRGAKPRPSARDGGAIARAPRRAADRSGMTVAATSWCVAGPPSSAICDVLRERGLEGGDATRRARARVDGSGKAFADAARRAGCPSGRTRRAARAATCEGCLDHGRGPEAVGGRRGAARRQVLARPALVLRGRVVLPLRACGGEGHVRRAVLARARAPDPAPAPGARARGTVETPSGRGARPPRARPRSSRACLRAGDDRARSRARKR